MSDHGGSQILIGAALFAVSTVMFAAARAPRPTKRMGFRCIALDLDGTTLNSKHEVSAHTKSVLHRLHASGIKICVCTGRSVVSVLPILQTIGLPGDVPIVVYNGSSSFVVSPEMQITQRLFSTPHSRDDAELLIAFAQRLGLVAQYYLEHSGDVFAVPTTDDHHRLLEAYAQLTGRPQVIGTEYAEALSQSPAAKVLLMSRDVGLILAEAEKIFPPGKFNVVRGSPDPFFVEFLPANISKGSGLRNMCAALGLLTEEVVAFGDGDNDAEFLEYAGLGVAMKNAKDAAKTKADVVLERTNDEDGVAHALEILERAGYFGILQ